MNLSSAYRRAILRWGGPACILAAVSAAEAWIYADAVLRGAASPPPRILSRLAGYAGARAVLLDMFAAALAVNFLVFSWCRRLVEAQRAKIAEIAKTTLTPEERARLREMIVARLRADRKSGPPGPKA